MVEANPPTLFTTTSAYSLTAVAVIAFVAYSGSKRLLSPRATFVDKATFIWLAFDGLIHLTFEGSFLYLSTGGRTVVGSTGPLAEMWKEYARADIRWGISDPTVVSLEYLTVLGAGPMCFWILYQLINDDPARHYWIVVLSTAELYGGWMTFCPEWLTGSTNLVTSNWLYLWVYLTFMNVLWVFIPLWLMVDSYQVLAKGVRSFQASRGGKKAN